MSSTALQKFDVSTATDANETLPIPLTIFPNQQ